MSLRLVHDGRPGGHDWRKGPNYRASIGGGEFLQRTNTIRCKTCGVVAYWCAHDRAYYVDASSHTYRDVMPTCEDERVKQAEDAEYQAAIDEGEEEGLP